MKGLTASLLLLAATAAYAQDYSLRDPHDKDDLERALYLCQWKQTHDIPDDAPTPAVCRSAVVSMDDAILQNKQWWTFWARVNTDDAVKARARFNQDFLGFLNRQKLTPALAQQLLPAGIELTQGDWRVQLVRSLAARPSTTDPWH